MKGFQSFLRKIKENNTNLFLISLIVFIASITVNVFADRQIEKYAIKPIPFPVPSIAPYPLLNPVLGESSVIPQLTAEAAVAIDPDSKVVLFSKNENLRFSSASTTKIMTALVALEYFNLEDILTVKTDNVEGSVVGLKKGEKYYLKDLLYGMLLPSGNDAALAIAQNFPGGEVEFVKKMNEKAKSLNLYNTHYGDPAGLLDDADFTSPLDLVTLASIAIKNPVIANIVITKEAVISDINGSERFEIKNLNKLLGEDGVTGIKTGFTDIAGGVLVTSRVEKNHTFIIVVMKSQDRFTDTQKILDAISGNVNFESIHP